VHDPAAAVPRRLRYPAARDDRGALVAVEADETPFPVHRAFSIAGVPPGAVRGGHAHRTCHELIVAVTGAFTVVTDGPAGVQSHRLDQPGDGLHLPPRNWCELREFSADAVCLVLASHRFDPADHLPRAAVEATG
jgi:hypothetical protein